MSVIVHSARVVDGGVVTENGWVRFDDGRVAASGLGDTWQTEQGITDAVDATDAAGQGAVLTPGFVDLHGHGGGGFAYDDGVEAIRAARAVHRAHGTTRAVISLVTAELDTLAERVRTVAALTRTDPDVLGSHLEGPFLDQGHKGAHDPALLRPPTAAALDALLEAGAGTVRQITLAPELAGGLDAVRRVVAAGAAVAVGHTGGDLAATAAAFDAGATILTHAFNGMPGLHHRAPGPVGAALSDSRVTIEAIADGVHLHPSVVRILFAAAPGRVALITDAMAAACAPDGRYRLGALDVDVENGVAHLAGGTTIAGSTLTQDAALRIAVAAGVPLGSAVHGVTRAPAIAIGRDDLGSFDRGAVGDAVLLDADLRVRRVWVAGAPA